MEFCPPKPRRLKQNLAFLTCALSCVWMEPPSLQAPSKGWCPEPQAGAHTGFTVVGPYVGRASRVAGKLSFFRGQAAHYLSGVPMSGCVQVREACGALCSVGSTGFPPLGTPGPQVMWNRPQPDLLPSLSPQQHPAVRPCDHCPMACPTPPGLATPCSHGGHSRPVSHPPFLSSLTLVDPGTQELPCTPRHSHAPGRWLSSSHWLP